MSTAEKVALLGLVIALFTLLINWYDMNARIRPFMGVSGFISNNNLKEGEEGNFGVVVQNVGSIPANNAIVSTRTFQGEKLEPFYSNVETEKKVVIPQNSLSKKIVFPNLIRMNFGAEKSRSKSIL